MTEENTALISIEQIKPAVVFTAEGMEEVIARIEEQGRSLVPDITTDKGRDEIKSLAYKVARSKTLLDNAGKEFASDLKSKVKIIDGARKSARDRLDALKEEIRKPLTDWEAEMEKKKQAEIEAEQKRIDIIQTRIGAINSIGADAYTVAELQIAIAGAGEVDTDNEFDEFVTSAEIAKSGVLIRLNERLASAQEAERIAAQAEEDRKRMAAQQAEMDRQQKERDDAQAKIDEENRLIHEQQEEAQRKIEADNAQIEADKAAEAKRGQDEIDRKEAEQKEFDRIAREEKDSEAKRLQAIKEAKANKELFADDSVTLLALSEQLGDLAKHLERDVPMDTPQAQGIISVIVRSLEAGVITINESSVVQSQE